MLLNNQLFKHDVLLVRNTFIYSVNNNRKLFILNESELINLLITLRNFVYKFAPYAWNLSLGDHIKNTQVG